MPSLWRRSDRNDGARRPDFRGIHRGSQAASRRVSFYLLVWADTREANDIYGRQLRRPSISIGGGKALYWAAPPQLEASTRPNLSKTLKELLTGKDDLLVTDSSLPIELNLRVTLT